MVCKPAEQGKGGGEENMYVGERRGEKGIWREKRAGILLEEC